MAKTQMVLVLVIFYAVDTSLATVFATANPLARSQCATRQASPWHIIIFVFILATLPSLEQHITILMITINISIINLTRAKAKTKTMTKSSKPFEELSCGMPGAEHLNMTIS